MIEKGKEMMNVEQGMSNDEGKGRVPLLRHSILAPLHPFSINSPISQPTHHYE
jgi:hypothetical protein